MSIDSSTINKLTAFQHKQKFANSAWEERGLNASSGEMCSQLEEHFNVCADDLINAVKNGVSSKQLKKILKAELSHLKSSDYDTEEREFICDYFSQLSNIVDVDIKSSLNVWLYGIILNSLLKVTYLLKKREKVIETLSRNCTKCGSILETFVLKKEIGIPEHNWYVIRCDECNELNLLSLGPGIKEMRFGKFKLVEQLDRNKYSEAQAKTRVEQIKYFRK
jgi:hypothetical protein